MKPGEKKVIWFVMSGLSVVIGLTVYLELEHRKGDAAQKVVQLANEDLTATSTGPGTAIIPKGINPEELPDSDERGATLLVLYCAQCHELPTPLMHTAMEWQDVVKRMQERIHAMRGGMLSRVIMPPEKDWKTLTQYITSHAQKALEPSSVSDLETPAGRAFQATCSACHAMPDPTQHTAKEWPRVVARMKSNMRSAHVSQPNDETTTLVVSYLQSHAG